MTKADVVSRIAAHTGLTKTDVQMVVEGFIDSVKKATSEGESLEIRGFGSFHVVKRAPRTARNPKTGEVVKIPSRNMPVFKPSNELRKLCNKL